MTAPTPRIVRVPLSSVQSCTTPPPPPTCATGSGARLHISTCSGFGSKRSQLLSRPGAGTITMSFVPPIKVYPDKFAGQVVLITGAAQGIGEVTSILFGSQGATVVLVD